MFRRSELNLTYTISEYQGVGKSFYNKLRLMTFPVAIKYFKEESEIPEDNGILRPSKINQKISLCRAFTIARRWGRTVVMRPEDNHCITSSFVQDWDYIPSKQILKSQIISKYHNCPSAEMKIQLEFAGFFTKESREKLKGNIGFIVSPLQETLVVPDVILCYGNPAQMMHIIHALTYEGRNLVKNQNFLGYEESCIRGVLIPYISGKTQIVIPGTRDRTLGLTTDDEMAIGFTGKKLFYIHKHLFKTAGKLNPGMPSKFMMLGIPDGMGPPAYRFLKRQLKQFKKGRIK